MESCSSSPPWARPAASALTPSDGGLGGATPHIRQCLAVACVRQQMSGRALYELTVAFDLEGTEPLDGSLDMIETYYDLGVRTMLMAYNEPNRAGGGCHGDPEIGLTAFGQAVVREMNRIGMLVDATHCSRRTTFD